MDTEPSSVGANHWRRRTAGRRERSQLGGANGSRKVASRGLVRPPRGRRRRRQLCLAPGDEKLPDASTRVDLAGGSSKPTASP